MMLGSPPSVAEPNENHGASQSAGGSVVLPFRFEEQKPAGAFLRTGAMGLTEQSMGIRREPYNTMPTPLGREHTRAHERLGSVTGP